MQSGTACPGCGVILPAADGVVPPGVDASAACALVHAELEGFQVQHPVMLRYHQLIADAYTAQHAADAPLRRTGSALVGLWLSIEHGFSGEDVRSVHRRLGPPTADWPMFEAPAPPQRWLTVVDVAEAGVRQRSESGHARAVAAWADSVWETWQAVRPGTDDAVERLLASVFLEDGRAARLHGTIGAASAVHRLQGLLQG